MKKTIFLAALTAAIFAGCSSDNPMLPVEGGNGNNGGEGNNELISRQYALRSIHRITRRVR